MPFALSSFPSACSSLSPVTLPSSVFDRAFGFVSGTFDVFAVHENSYFFRWRKGNVVAELMFTYPEEFRVHLARALPGNGRRDFRVLFFRFAVHRSTSF